MHKASAGVNDIKLLVLDIDGTITGDSNTLSVTVKEVIAAVQAKGIKVAIATGRMYCSALRFHQEIGSTLPLIAYQGAWIQDPGNDKIHRHLPVSREITQQLLEYFEQPDLRSLLSVHFYINDQLYVREITKETDNYQQRCGVTAISVGDLRQLLDHEPTKILALSEDANLTQQLLADLRLRYKPTDLYMTTSVPTFLEAANTHVNKGNAVRYLAEEMLGLESHHVMTIGDNFNDVEMLSYAGISVAMGNAPPEVQAIANWVAPSIELDGAAIAIEKFLLS
ncbi:HAD family hydrolase [Dolichospermum circinale CS-1225]|uniref:HAD family hydrolase n=1 Tax=Dolichospermum circinale CS-537/01 TaxID=3021739 RepID=A0ABT5AAC5_9CYAN|nr:HAD family hydrolase [Dolichospermum circinale]MDB9457288.1 HAD family hydrolase [Dolichospermum circinale CS-545/17]MDB9466451.1 HAD family hydrolase [Dolichospermum circinale CS-539/09]MDB9470427.1 HAD family hydrolase [Dolichospermum circinale CS-539]MDB9488051.1 HAD family hydrolase [Dolichospermum circinale CS-537/01]MDB9521339.1 HAD family hydrolase [Dolichospermum circinale CS-1225]